jgi:16S rRNA (cytidine1402-2'-O)-methyltransferase
MMQEEETLEPGLYLVATPLGHLGDLSPRAREILSRASFLAAESGAAAGRWLEILKATPKPRVLSYREASREADACRILARLAEGATVALISDAGTPCISDPGWHLVDLARQAGHPVWAVPGPCAAIQALVLSGFPCRRFVFEGFLPQSGKARREALARLQSEMAPVILYESPHRLLETLSALERLPERPLYIGRELTKKFEESWRGTTSVAAAEWVDRPIRGELTLVLGPQTEVDPPAVQVPEETICFLLSLGLPARSATAVLKHFYPAASKKELYRRFSEG